MKKLALLSFCLLIGLFAISVPVFAQSNDDATKILPQGETIDGNYFASGGNVIVSGTVNGDAYLAGGTVLVDGVVNGDVIAAGGNVIIRGDVQNIRVAGGQVTIDGTVQKNITAGAGSLTVSDSANVMGSIIAGAGSLSILGPIAKEAYLGGEDILIANTVGSDVYGAGAVQLGPKARIGGSLKYISETKANIASGATVSGIISQTFPEVRQKQEKTQGFPWGLLGAIAIIGFIGNIIIGIILLKLLPEYSNKVVKQIMSHPWLNLGIGFLSVIIAPIAIVILLITIIGIPMALFLGFALAILMFIGKLFIAVAIGGWTIGKLSKAKVNAIWALILGLIIYNIVKIIPIIGWILSPIALLIGLGALLILEKQYYQQLRKSKII